MEFEEQITNVEVIVDRTPRVYLKWTNTEEGRDKNDCYERITIDVNTPYYVNTHNRNSLIMYGHPFWDKLEKMYNDTILKSTNSTKSEKTDVKSTTLLDINDRYYFKTRGQEPDIECTEKCMFRNSGINIGSVSCQECSYHLENDMDEWANVSWIRCSKINEAVSKK